jgi:hypothetical protein
VDEDGASPIRHGRDKRVQVEPPFPVTHHERHEPWHGAHQAHAVDHPRVRRIGEDDLISGIGEAEEGVEDGGALAAGDDDLPPSVVARAAATLDERRHRLLEVVATGERQPAVRVVLADRRPGGLHRGGGGRDVGVEVLEAQDLGVVAGCSGDAVDVEARDVLETPDAHARTLLSFRPSLTPGRRLTLGHGVNRHRFESPG